ncbi:hypothetical protein BESB_005910 [Besnoitia besnoiti]|uniref:Transmembrane protein n=1 Tax=Besnoitia besnoiti TaxID=94643 RepID=A0A2A9MQE8_BESBE|nr:hypothetical protein BESB_005910 [Besnoitia besnoiti]PFH38250.1 hypothetical protein BESB_005910 [Besnoitia besnoiti]
MAVNQGGRATSSDSFCFPAQARKRPKECAATATDGRRGLSSMHPRRMCACDKHESEALNSLSTVGAARRNIVAGCCEFEATLRRPRGLHSSSRLPRYSVTVAFGTLMFLISCSTVPGSLCADASSLGVLPRIPFILFSARWFLLASRGVVSAATAAHLSLQEAWFSSSDSPFASASPSSFSPSAVAKGRAAYDAFQRDAEETRHQGGSRARAVESCWREVLREINLLQSLPSAQACSSLGEASREYIALLRARCIYTRTGRAFPNARQGCYLVPDEIPASWLMPPRADGAGSGDGGETGKAERQQDVEGERRSASGGGGGHAARPRERENGASSEAGATLDPPQRPESYAAEGREGIEGGGDRQAGTAADARREATERRQGAPRLENPCLTLEAFLTLRLEHRAGGFEEALRIQGSGNDEVDAANSSARQQPSPSASFAASVESQGEQAEARRGARHAPAGSGLPGRSRSLPRESEEEAQTDDLHMQASRRLLLALSDTGRGDRNVGEAATLKSLMESCEALRQRVVVGCQHARSMDFGTFALVREQINHIDNICFFLHSAEWQRRSDETVTRLAVASGAVASHLRAQARNLEEMHAIQRQQLEGGWQVTHLLQNLQHGMQDVFAALHQIRSFHRYLADAVGSAQTFFFYLFALLLSLVFTAHVRLQGARLSLFTLLLLLASAEVAARKWGLSALLFLRLKYLQGTDLAAGLIRLLLAGDDNEIQAGRETPFFEKHKRAWDDPSLEDIEAVAFWLRCVYTSAAVAIWLHRALLHKTAEDLLREEMKKL